MKNACAHTPIPRPPLANSPHLSEGRKGGAVLLGPGSMAPSPSPWASSPPCEGGVRGVDRAKEHARPSRQFREAQQRGTRVPSHVSAGPSRRKSGKR